MIRRLAAAVCVAALLAAIAHAETYTIKFDEIKGCVIPPRCPYIESVSPWGATKQVKKGLALSYHGGPDDKVKHANEFGKAGGVRIALSNPGGDFKNVFVYVYVKDRSTGKAPICLRPEGGLMKRGKDAFGDGCHAYTGIIKPRSTAKVNIWTKGDGDYLIEKIDVIVREKKK